MKKLHSLFVFLILVSQLGCERETTFVNKTVIAKVGSIELTLEQAKAEIPREVFLVDSAFALSSYRNRWIKEQIWYQEASRSGFATDPAIQFKAENAKNQLIAHLYRRGLIEGAEPIAVTDQEIKDFYAKNSKEFTSKEERVRVLHFKASDLKTALEAKSRLTKGETIEAVVNEIGLDKEATILASKQFVDASKALGNAPLLKQYLAELKQEKEISPIRRIGDNFHFVQLIDFKKPGESVESGEVFTKIREWLLVEKRRQYLIEKEQNLLLQAKAAGEVKTFLLPEISDDQESNR